MYEVYHLEWKQWEWVTVWHSSTWVLEPNLRGIKLSLPQPVPETLSSCFMTRSNVSFWRISFVIHSDSAIFSLCSNAKFWKMYGILQHPCFCVCRSFCKGNPYMALKRSLFVTVSNWCFPSPEQPWLSKVNIKIAFYDFLEPHRWNIANTASVSQTYSSILKAQRVHSKWLHFWENFTKVFREHLGAIQD